MSDKQKIIYFLNSIGDNLSYKEIIHELFLVYKLLKGFENINPNTIKTVKTIDKNYYNK